MYRYIIVDDEEPIQKGILKKLESMEDTIACVGTAFNGEDALTLIEEKNPDIIITDMNMPVMSGKTLLKELTLRYSSKQIIVVSGYKDFEYLHEAIVAHAIDYILKPFGKTEIIKAMQKAIRNIEEHSTFTLSLDENNETSNLNNDLNIIRNIIYDKPVSSTEMNSHRLFYINSSNHMLMITLHSSEIISEVSMQKFLDDNEFGNYAVYLQHESNPNISFLILFIPENSLIDYGKFSQQITDSILSLYRNSVDSLILGLSNIHQNIRELHTAFEESVNAMNCRKISDNYKVYAYPQSPGSYQTIIWPQEDEFMFRLETGNLLEIRHLVDCLFDYLQTLPITVNDIKQYCINLTDKTRLLMTQYFKQVHPISISHSSHAVFFTMFTLNEFQQYYIQFFTNVAIALKDKNFYTDSNIVEQMKLYIQNNFQKNISIELLSNLFYLNRSYCSSIFKERTGQNFTDYLNTLRIEHAKKLLVSTNKKNTQIALDSGYPNVKYFYRIFKKKTKMTPEAYRALYVK